MKKIIVAFILFTAITTLTNAQDVLEKAKSGAASAAGSSLDVKSVATSIMGALGPSLGLTDAEKTPVLTEVTSLLTKKKDILPLQMSDNAAYVSKFSALSSGFLGKMKGILTAAKYAKLLGLKPKTATATNVLSQLFF
ncbi:MAG: hypothetical protein ABIN89_06895 [Chitinophagaceae bacterium]